MTPFWTPVIKTPFEAVGSSVRVIVTLHRNGFQGECGQCQQQCSHVPTLVEGVLDIRRSGEVLPAVVWTSNYGHNGGGAGRHYDVDTDDSSYPTEARAAPGS
jgi:hypothetical protein